MDEIENINIELEHKHNDSLIAQLNSKSIENADLKGQIQEKVFVTIALQNELSRLKGKNVLDNASTITNATNIALGIFKLDIEPISHRLKNNRDAYEDLLVYVSKTCPSLTKSSEKLVAVTPKNKDKKVRFADPVTSSNNTQKQVDSHKNQDSNQPLLHSIGVICSTSASGSHPTINTKNNRILQSSSSNKANKVEDQSRSVKSRKNNKNRVAKTECNAYVMQSMLDATSKPIFAIYVNVHSKSKSTKSNKKQNIWKPTGKVFTEIGYRWKPTRRTFTLVSNSCPLTRITSTKVVHFKDTTSKSLETQKPEIKVYSRKPKPIKSVGLSSKFTIVKSRITNTTEPNQYWGSNALDVPSSSSLFDFKLSRLCSKHMGYGDYQLGNVTISRVYYVEGLGHILFSVEQYCDSDLKVALRKHTCHIRDLDGVDLLKRLRGSNLYTLSLENMISTSPTCLLSKASKTKSWLWHLRLSHLNFEYITQLAKQGMVHGIPRLKFQKDHLCSACALGKSKKHTHKPKAKDFI
ncbi:retrovirus-related pol polyprotein from transposon TNT 1-94 [Tanacetum coccineum]